MLTRLSVVVIGLIGLLPADFAFGQTDLQRAQNLATCLTGKHPILCKRQWLTSEESQKVAAAERQENLRICLTGKYPILCRRDKLSPEETERTAAAERSENRRICLTGRYPILCKKNLLTEPELKEVLVAERAENLRVCLTGLYPQLCNKSRLTQEELSRVAAAERQAGEMKGQRAGPARRGSGRVGSAGCEAGHWIESVAAEGRIIKLEDGSIWEVDAVDVVYSMIWLPITDIVICGDKLINTDDDETVSAQRIR